MLSVNDLRKFNSFADRKCVFQLGVVLGDKIALEDFSHRTVFCEIVGQPEPEKKYVDNFEYILAAMLKVYLGMF